MTALLNWIWIPIGIIVVVGYVALMNWLGGEKYILGNRIQETIRILKQNKNKK